MTQALDMNIAGRVMMVLSRHGVTDARQLRIYIGAVGAAVDHQMRSFGDSAFDQLEAIFDRQSALLDEAVRHRAQRSAQGDMASGSAAAQVPVEQTVAATVDETRESATDDRAPDAGRRRARRESGYVPVARSLEQKLQEDRKPIQKLLTEDCVAAGLLDKKRAATMASRMSGKTTQDAEREIVEQLREILQQQIRHFIRKSKGGPWATPRQQNDLQQDVHRATTIRSVLMLTRQVVKERETWEKEHGRLGILGLFSARH